MYDKRVKVFVIVSAFILIVCVLRLIEMQLLPDSRLLQDIAELKRGQSRQLKTIRGRILDRKGRVLAVDEPRFRLSIDYKLGCLLDGRIIKARLLKAARQDNPEAAISKVQKELKTGLENLRQIIIKCTRFGISAVDIENRIRQINDDIWNLRWYLAWKRNYPDTDFAQALPDPNERLLLTARMDIAEMHKGYPLCELKTDDDVFEAQMEFMDLNDVHIVLEEQRLYPYSSAAAQTIGWVGPATQEDDKRLFANDKLASYLGGEVCGREDGIEYVCEAALRGRRGELVSDIDRRMVSRTETQLGQDVQITLDIELQQKIETYLADYPHDPNCGPGMAAVIIEVASGDILTLVSMPVFDLNRVRYEYGALAGDHNKPLINRAINKQYPPGSVVKPLILIAGLESGKITPDKIISCPAQPSPVGWPNCWIYNDYKIGHDNSWSNNARNAIKGSCNIYFSRLADSIEPSVLQQWLFEFGYGHPQLFLVHHPSSEEGRETRDEGRDFRQAPGQISTVPPTLNFRFSISDFRFIIDNWQSAIGNRLPVLEGRERRLFGIGHGNLRATPMQVANAMAAIARRGVYKPPRLFIDSTGSSIEHQVSSIDLNISPQTLEVIYDGMSAVVNEPGGTANREFAYSSFSRQDVKVYGKTGSTEEPEVAWFAGFAQDSTGRKLAIAVVVEGGQHGSSDAAPLARDIIKLCIEAGYIGRQL